MTFFFLAVLISAWLGYFFYPIKDNKSDRQRRNKTAEFDRSLIALGGPSNGYAVPLATDIGRRVLFDQPRSSYEAGRRRRKVIIALSIISVGALASFPMFGLISLTVFLFAIVSLLGMICMSTHLKYRAAEKEIESLILSHDSDNSVGPQSAAPQML